MIYIILNNDDPHTLAIIEKCFATSKFSDEELENAIETTSQEYCIDCALVFQRDTRTDPYNQTRCDLEEKYNDAFRDEDFIVAKRDLINLFTSHGWKCVRDKNGSAYFENSDQTRMRFSDHELTSDWTGREQTGGALVDFVWSRGETANSVMGAMLEELSLCE